HLRCRCPQENALRLSWWDMRNLKFMMPIATEKNSDFTFLCLPSLEEVEVCRKRGPLVLWEDLMRSDESSTFFQSPQWCMAWYRVFRNSFQPLVILLMSGNLLRGLAPLAIERETGRLVFAGDTMADYHDVIAVEGSREPLIAE